MVDDISLRAGKTAGMQRTGEVEGLSTADAMAKISGSQGKLETRQATLEANIKKEEANIKKEEKWLNDHKWMKNSCHGKGAYGKHQTALKNARSNLAAMKNELPNVKHDIGVMKQVMTGLQADMQAKAEMLKSALESGDFEAALGMVLNDRLDGLDAQLKAKVTDMSKRNEEILALNNKLSSLKGDPKKNAKAITKIQGEIDKLNSDSQLDMIKLQSLTNKRNQAFELMSNLTQKFSQSVDKVIGNIR